MPTGIQYQIVKKQVESFRHLNCDVIFEIQPMSKVAAPKIVIYTPKKCYKFSDPDWDIVSRQLATLYIRIKNEH